MKSSLSALAISALFALSLNSQAHEGEEPGHMHDGSAPAMHNVQDMHDDMHPDEHLSEMRAHMDEAHGAWAQGKVRRINKSLGKVTLRHGPLQAVDMPAMSMVFSMRNRKKLDLLEVGDEIEFQVIKDKDGNLVITDIRHK